MIIPLMRASSTAHHSSSLWRNSRIFTICSRERCCVLIGASAGFDAACISERWDLLGHVVKQCRAIMPSPMPCGSDQTRSLQTGGCFWSVKSTPE